MPEVTVSADGVISVRHEGGGGDHYHTDPDEIRDFVRLSKALNKGAAELGMLLYGGKEERFREMRAIDGRSDTQLKGDWLEKVIGAGATPEEARNFLFNRLRA